MGFCDNRDYIDMNTSLFNIVSLSYPYHFDDSLLGLCSQLISITMVWRISLLVLLDMETTACHSLAGCMSCMVSGVAAVHLCSVETRRLSFSFATH